jgi:hypothetical protein
MWWAALLNTVLGSLSTGAPPAALSSYESIATVTASGGETSFTFSSIPSTYKSLQIRGINSNASDPVTLMRFNGDTGTNYAWHVLYGNGSAGAASGVSGNAMYFVYTSSTAGIFGSTVTDIIDYASTSKYKTLRALSGNDRNGAGDMTFYSGLWQSTSAISSITILPASGNFRQYSTFALYGIKD